MKENNNKNFAALAVNVGAALLIGISSSYISTISFQSALKVEINVLKTQVVNLTAELKKVNENQRRIDRQHEWRINTDRRIDNIERRVNRIEDRN